MGCNVALRLPVLVSALVMGLMAIALMSAPAMAQNAPGWELDSRSYPTNLPPGSSGVVAIDVFNIGAAESTEGEGGQGAAVLEDTLPAGLEGVSGGGWTCSSGTPSACSRTIGKLEQDGSEEYKLPVNVGTSAAEGTVNNVASISGGGATAVTKADSLEISAQPAKFGFAHVDSWFANADGSFDTQAGSHPYAFTFNFDLNTTAGQLPIEGEARNLTVNLPPGLVGAPTAVAQCPREQFDAETCPIATQIGVEKANIEGNFDFLIPVFNLVPPPDKPAEFGFVLSGNQVLLDASVRSDGDYGITEHIDNLPQRAIVENSLSIWGTPSAPSHDKQRFSCPNLSERCRSTAPSVPLLTTPTACAGPQTSSASLNDWLDESITSEFSFSSHDKEGRPQGFEGCESLDFTPTISVAPDTSNAETPAGLSVEIKTPQEGLTSPQESSLAGDTPSFVMANIKDTRVVLPEGVVINPGQAAGLTACQAGEDGVGSQGPPSCPGSSQVGTDEIDTPLLAHPLKGGVYILQSNPPDLQLLVSAEGEGVFLKLVGDVHLDETTGRLTTTFKETPELPFTSFKLAFSGGARAALVTPAGCGEFTTTSDFTPWSAPFGADVFPSSRFLISSGCASPVPFAPVLTAGSTTDQAGGFTDFSLLLTRADEQQHIEKLQFKTPEGLLGMISKVPLCGEPQAAEGTCSSASQIGHTQVTAGPGPYPLVVPEPGQGAAPIYLTGGYKGAPYGLSIVVPVIAGPFNLGTVVVRASIAVDPVTAQLTVTTDPLPSILDGIPTDLRTINAVIDRPGFMFNPTNCSPQEFAGSATSTQGTTVPISSHFQMGSCRSLTFKPDFKVSTTGQSTKANGTSLDAKIVYPTTPLGANQASSQANIASVKVDLPIQMPSRLSTLQKACLAKVFEENPASCPADSRVGIATAVTPVLPVPLTGPAYFVSHGGEAFPSLIVVLQGYGVTVDLVGTTFISKAGITSSTFKQVPDVPITSFDLKLPQGPYSALAANLPVSAHGSYCGQKLVMPTHFVAQNGAEIQQNTPITVEGCSSALSIKTSVKNQTVTVTVYAPAAGKLTATGKGLTTASKTAKGQENVTFTLKQKKTGRLNTAVKVNFKPTKGKPQTKATKIKLKK
jgi:hypothetical protein